MFRFSKPTLTAVAPSTHRLAGNQANRFDSLRTSPIRGDPAFLRKLMSVKILQVAALMLPTYHREESISAGMDMGSGPGRLSFRRIVGIPFETCVASLEGWQREGDGGELQVGQSGLHGPIEHDRGSGTCRVEVRLAPGPLRLPLRMRLDVDCWSPSSTALELIPCGRVRATAGYFRAGHLLLDSLAYSLQLEQEIHALDQTGREKVETETVRPSPRSPGTRDLRPPNALPR